MTDPFQPNEAWLQSLRDRQIAFFERWLQSDEAKNAWLKLAEELRETFLKTPISQLLDRAAIDEALTSTLANATIENTHLPALERALTTTAEELSARPEPVGEFVSAKSQQLIDELLAEPKLLSEPLLRAAIQNQAAEVLMHEILYDALRQFSDKVNPFFADWGIPALLDRLPALARGPAKKAFSGMRDEFDRRLEPEIKRFLKGFCRRALARTADMIIDHDTDPDFVRLRQQLAAKIREQGIADLVYPLDEPRATLAIRSACEVARTILGSDILHKRLSALSHEQLQRYADTPLEQVLEANDLALPPTSALALACWPAIQTALGSEALRTQIAKVIDASHAELLQDG